MPFTILLDSTLTSSWDGDSIYDCSYYVDLKSLLKPDDMKKQYKMVWSIFSTTGAPGLTGAECIRVHIDIGKAWKSQRNLQNSSFVGTTLIQATGGLYRFNQNTQQNPPMICEGLVDISIIKVQFYTDATTLYTNVNGNTQNYIIMMYFDEIDLLF